MILKVEIELRVGAFDLDVSFETSGGITALFGPSGAGKTLTLRSVAGLITPRSGRIALADRVVFDSAAGVGLPPQERGFGFVFQQYALFPHLTVEQNVGFGLHHLQRTDRGERVHRLLELVALEGLEKRRPAQLSGGQQQRVALARALATEPQLLLLDEPFAAVDLRVRRRLREELRRIHQMTGTPMLLVTHDLHEVKQLSDSLVLVEHGRVLASGPTASVLDQSQGSELMELLGA